MKTSRANSFRLHNIGKSVSLRRTSQTVYNPDESFKLAAIHSVFRSVKNNDISFMTGMDLHKLRREPLELGTGLYESAHANLTQVRKNYDQMKKKRIEMEETIEHLKTDLNKYLIYNEQHDQSIKNGRQKADDLSTALRQKRTDLELAIAEKKVLLYMASRHKADRVFYDQKKYNLEKQLSNLKKQLQIFTKSGHGIGEEMDRTRLLQQRLAKQLESQRLQRMQHLSNMQDMINEKEACVAENQIRQVQINDIASRAMQDKDHSEKQWRKIFLTHSLVNKVLRNKIDKEMEKFKVVQQAFKEIKTATGVTDAKTLISKYLNKETVYGELLGKIAQNEKTIQTLKNDTQGLIKEQKDLEMELEIIQSIKVKSQDLHSEIKRLGTVDEQTRSSESYRYKMAAWTVKQIKKIQGADRRSEDIATPKTTADTVRAFNAYLQLLQTTFKQVQPYMDTQDKYSSESVLSNRDIEKVFRIQPKRSRRNSIGEEIFDVDEQETNPSANHDEQQTVNAQREQMLRLNEKFMKEMKRKRDEERKLHIQKTADKKEKMKVPEVKHELE